MTISIKRLDAIVDALRKAEINEGRRRYNIIQLRMFMAKYGIVDKYQFKDAVLYLESRDIGTFDEFTSIFSLKVPENVEEQTEPPKSE